MGHVSLMLFKVLVWLNNFTYKCLNSMLQFKQFSNSGVVKYSLWVHILVRT